MVEEPGEYGSKAGRRPPPPPPGLVERFGRKLGDGDFAVAPENCGAFVRELSKQGYFGEGYRQWMSREMRRNLPHGLLLRLWLRKHPIMTVAAAFLLAGIAGAIAVLVMTSRPDAHSAGASCLAGAPASSPKAPTGASKESVPPSQGDKSLMPTQSEAGTRQPCRANVRAEPPAGESPTTAHISLALEKPVFARLQAESTDPIMNCWAQDGWEKKYPATEFYWWVVRTNLGRCAALRCPKPKGGGKQCVHLNVLDPDLYPEGLETVWTLVGGECLSTIWQLLGGNELGTWETFLHDTIKRNPKKLKTGRETIEAGDELKVFVRPPKRVSQDIRQESPK